MYAFLIYLQSFYSDCIPAKLTQKVQWYWSACNSVDTWIQHFFNMVQSRPLFVFSSFSYYNSNLNWKKQRVDDVLKIQTRGHRMVGADGSTELWRMPELGIQNYVLQTLYQDFYSPTPTLMAFTGVTNAHGPSPLPTACRSASCSLMSTTESNQT